MSWLDTHATTALEAWRDQGLERTPAVFASAQDPVATIDGAERVLFSSSNYLGLSTDQHVVAAARGALERYGAGSGGSRLTTGTTAEHRLVEEAFARFLGYPDAVFFSSGFHANTAVLHTLAGPDLTIFSDERNHASIIDGCRLAKQAGAATKVYRHRDPAHLAELLDQHAAANTGARALVVSDGLFSMDGTLAPLPELTEVCRAYGVALMVDDAHGTGTLGATGRGIVEHFGLQDTPPDILVATASKALGAEGGAVATTRHVADMLRQQARPYVYSTSTSAANCAAVRAAIEVLERTAHSDDGPVRALHRNVARLACALGYTEWPSPIIPIWIGDEAEAMAAAAALREAGFFVPAIRYPTVPRGKAMLRVTVMATHTIGQIEALVEALERR
ncbi:8-amino-7-oxononanoate synthase [Corynebacterium sp. TA-R-1]|uniref:8-amino-7-oxononanoate synthase n=1 Tax=Corynebacterium stercoris TaxID=2943490 RepID=A0ABT1G3P4_9CORY|nr:8-amino-7-oxononanoate synthase [Corynebacterium stercoris]MCP1388649.1 8-amino-7-oxononanoate synthase [Corynebacterium stercoris]